MGLLTEGMLAEQMNNYILTIFAGKYKKRYSYTDRSNDSIFGRN